MSATSHGQAVCDLRLCLLAAGYEPIPIIAADATDRDGHPLKSRGKRPRISGWERINITPDEIRRWTKTFANDTNTGIRCGKIIGVDIDVLDATLALDLEELAITMLGKTPLRRIGRAPKLLLVYVAEDTITKITTDEYRLSDDSKAQVEILAAGQQFVSHGVHPDTGQPYRWTYRRPEETPISDVPGITAKRVRLFIAAAARLIEEHGGQSTKTTTLAQRAPTPPTSLPPREHNSSGASFFRAVNARALADLESWVTRLFPQARWQPNATTPPGAYRVSSASLGRPLQEDISIHATEGCQDFGTRESKTPIDLMIEWGGAPDAASAALTLCEWMRVDPTTLGWRHKSDNASSTQKAQSAQPSPAAEAKEETSPLWTDAAEWDADQIPPRPWVVPTYLMRGSVSMLSGHGAAGKSSLVVSWSISLATGKQIGQFAPKAPCVVVNYNVEDDLDEQRRRYSAALMAQKFSPADIKHRVIRCGPHDVGTLFERDQHTGRVLPTEAMVALEKLLTEAKADVLICDPLAELHNAEENDNTAMRAVVAAFRALAKRLNIAVLILHHDRKGTSAPGDVERMRGASALIGAARVVLTLSTMTLEEAEKFGVPPDQRRQHFRVDGGKSNYAPAQEAEWWRLTGYEIGNGETVAACMPWSPPSAFDGLSMADCVAILDTLVDGVNGCPFGAQGRARAEMFEVLEAKHGLAPERAKELLRAWIAAGTVTERPDCRSPNSRHTRSGYVVNREALSKMRQQIRAEAE